MTRCRGGLGDGTEPRYPGRSDRASLLRDVFVTKKPTNILPLGPRMGGGGAAAPHWSGCPSALRQTRSACPKSRPNIAADTGCPPQRPGYPIRHPYRAKHRPGESLEPRYWRSGRRLRVVGQFEWHENCRPQTIACWEVVIRWTFTLDTRTLQTIL